MPLKRTAWGSGACCHSLALPWVHRPLRQAFSLLSERCFRFIHHEARHAQHGPCITEWRGRFKVGAVKWHAVEAFDGHRADLGRSSG